MSRVIDGELAIFKTRSFLLLRVRRVIYGAVVRRFVLKVYSSEKLFA